MSSSESSKLSQENVILVLEAVVGVGTKSQGKTKSPKYRDVIEPNEAMRNAQENKSNLVHENAGTITLGELCSLWALDNESIPKQNSHQMSHWQCKMLAAEGICVRNCRTIVTL